MDRIYLDHNATTSLLPEAEAAMRLLTAAEFGNPSSAHAAGRRARRALDDARERIAALLGANPEEVIFTSGATEANNLAVFGSRCSRASASHLEHPCVIEPLQQLLAGGVPVEWLPVTGRGVLDSLRFRPAADSLVCLMLANHETGAIQPVAEITQSLGAGARLHCDAAQAVGKIPVNFQALGAATLSVSGHKFGGPKGIGLLLVKRGVQLAPLMFGGHQEGGRRPGTEPVPLIVGMTVALEHAVRHLDENRAKLEMIRARFWEGLERTCAPVVLNGPEIGARDVVPTTLNVSFPGCRADLLLMALDLEAVACSTGSACSSGSLRPSPVLRAMGVADEVLRSAIRFSFAPSQSLEEIDEALRRVAGCVNRLRREA